MEKRIIKAIITERQQEGCSENKVRYKLYG
jgi:hypothetical protein